MKGPTLRRSIGRRPVPPRLLTVAATAIALAILLSSPASAQEPHGTIAFKDVHAGMKGYGKTVFSGTKIETFDVEVIGTLVNIAPKRNVILARLSGGPLLTTGVIEGMSGSPVYLDGKLAGAVAYSWGFSKEPVCGITPIDEMVDLLSLPAAERPERTSEGRGLPGDVSLLAWPARASTFLRDRLTRLAGSTTPAGVTRSRLPLLLGGGARAGGMGESLRKWEETFSSIGLRPVLSGAGGGDEEPAARLEPGSAVAVQLVRGDVEVAAIGTVTYTRGEDVLAFGHPFFGFGPTSLPMTAAQVYGTLPSMESSFKLASSGGPVGTITQDRFPGIRGVVGAKAPTVPVKLTIRSGKDEVESYAYEIAEDPLITPVMLHLTLLEILSVAEKEIGDVTLNVRKGSQIRVDGGLDVRFENVYSGDESETIASATVAYMTYLLMNNPDRPSRILGVDIDLEYADKLSLARIEGIWCDRYTVAPGETVPLHVSIRPYRGEPFVEDIPLEVPEEAPEGKAILQVGDAVTLSRMEFEAGGGSSFQPTSLEQLVFLLNRIRTNNRIYATLIRPDTGVIMSGERMPSLPPSISTVVLSPQREDSGAVRVRLRGILEEERDTDYSLRGYQKVLIEVKR